MRWAKISPYAELGTNQAKHQLQDLVEAVERYAWAHNLLLGFGFAALIDPLFQRSGETPLRTLGSNCPQELNALLSGDGLRYCELWIDFQVKLPSQQSVGRQTDTFQVMEWNAAERITSMRLLSFRHQLHLVNTRVVK